MIFTLAKVNAQLTSSSPLRPPQRLCLDMKSGSTHHHRPASRARGSSPFSHFPPEIIRMIVHQAAAVSLQTTLALTLVSKEIRAWVEPILYHTVMLWNPHTVELFRVAFDTKPPSFFAAHVRNLCVNGEEATDIIRACSNVQRLAAYPPTLVDLPDSDPEDEKMSSHLCGRPLRTHAALSCPSPVEIMLMGYLDDVPWASPLFHKVQFLYIGLEPPSPETACDLSLLPSLTYISFPYDGDAEDALLLTISILLESTTLQSLLVLVNDEEGNPDCDRKGCIWDKLACMADKRLLVGTEPIFDADDWVMMVNGGESMWKACEEEDRDWRRALL